MVFTASWKEFTTSICVACGIDNAGTTGKVVSTALDRIVSYLEYISNNNPRCIWK